MEGRRGRGREGGRDERVGGREKRERKGGMEVRRVGGTEGEGGR